MTEKLKIRQAVLVEGKYDKIKLQQLIDAPIFTTGGFSVFSSGEKAVLLRRIAEKDGLIILTDSDPAGFVIRNKLKGMLPKDKVLHRLCPEKKGEKKRPPKPEFWALRDFLPRLYGVYSRKAELHLRTVPANIGKSKVPLLTQKRIYMQSGFAENQTAPRCVTIFVQKMICRAV